MQTCDGIPGESFLASRKGRVRRKGMALVHHLNGSREATWGQSTMQTVGWLGLSFANGITLKRRVVVLAVCALTVRSLRPA